MAIPDTVSYSEFRAHLATYLDHVVDDCLPLVVKRRNGKKVVIVDEDHYNALDETAYLMSSPANHKKLMAAINSKKGIRYASAAEAFKKLGI